MRLCAGVLYCWVVSNLNPVLSELKWVFKGCAKCFFTGERKKWNFRKSSTSEASGNDGPSTFGLINPSSESKSKRTVSPTMIFENALSDHDEPNDIQHAKSPPTSLNLSQSATPVTRVSPKTPSADQGNKITRARQHSLPNERSLSPPPVINRPQSVRKADRINRQVSVPTLLQQQSLPSPFVTPGKNFT